jgi:hypothetical protein
MDHLRCHYGIVLLAQLQLAAKERRRKKQADRSGAGVAGGVDDRTGADGGRKHATSTKGDFLDDIDG